MNDSAIIAKHWELFPNYVFTDVETSLDLMAAEIHTLRMERGEVATQTVGISGASAAMQAGGRPRRDQNLPNATSLMSEQPIVNKDNAARAWDVVEEMFPASPGKPTDDMTLIERQSVSEYRYRFLSERANIILKHFPAQNQIVDDLKIALAEAEASEAQLARMAGEYERLYNEILGPMLTRCRAAQDAQHGGPAHDDCNTPSDWAEYIHEFAGRAEHHGQFIGSPESIGRYQANLIAVAGLAIAAIQSSQRKWQRGER